MCAEASIAGRVVDNRGDLEDVLGAVCILKPWYSSGYPIRDMCLCSVDLEATAEANGYRAEWDDTMSVCTFEPLDGPGADAPKGGE